MSGSVAVVDGVVPFIISGRTKSLEVVSSNDKDNSIFSTNEELSCVSSDSVGFRVGELVLSNGECYSGTLRGNRPEGSGKYVWSDGCAYEGEWRQGVRHGVGKLLFSSGAVYEGEFSGGYMQGTGTYVGSNNIVYKGRWRLSLKHGLGYQVYPHGDVFEGSWIQGTPEGPGKYTWVSGNVYLGNMKGGKLCGKGTLTWANGDTYEGSWLDSMMHGFGVYTWTDGGCYIGTWTRGLKDGQGSFYPKGSKVQEQVYLNALRKRGLLPDIRNKRQVSRINHASSVDMGHVKVIGRNHGARHLDQPRRENVSLERRWSMEVAIEKGIGHGSSYGLAELNSEGGMNEVVEDGPILQREYMQGVLISEIVLDSFSSSSRRAKRRQKRLAKDVKRPGEAIIKGHRSYELMVNLQLGIRYTVGKITPVHRREVRVSDFGPRASFWMNFPKEGSQLTPPHQSEDFRWKSYCPMVFRNLRELFKIDAGDYMMSICGNDALRELSSPGKSGSVFFLSQDDRFMIKTLRKSEVKVLLRMLPDYHHHVRTYDNTLITKFFGLHQMKPSSGQKFCFVVMGNMFCTELRIHRRFDLKGSSLGRSADKVKIDENTILKDLDLDYCFYLEPSWREDLLKQIEIDSKFLEAQHIMDYSLLLGVHYRAPQPLRSLMSANSADMLGIVTEEESMYDHYPQDLVLVPRGVDDSSVAVGPHIRGRRLRASSATGGAEVDLLLPGTARFQIQLGVNMPSRAQLMTGRVKTPLVHEVYDVVLYLGIIDILQDYNITKKIEHAYKSIQFDSISISVVDPVFYSERFLEFIQKVFPPNASTSLC